MGRSPGIWAVIRCHARFMALWPLSRRYFALIHCWTRRLILASSGCSSEWRKRPVTPSLIRLTIFGLAARSNPVNLPFFPIVSRAGRYSPGRSKDTGPSQGRRRVESLR